VPGTGRRWAARLRRGRGSLALRSDQEKCARGGRAGRRADAPSSPGRSRRR
jgi:hypothetical protein